MKPMGSPFKFLNPYEKQDKEIFFGREKEIELLYETTFKTNLLLVYGQSGTGKTSLIQCGLANRFRASDWFDLYIRRRGNIAASLQEEIRRKAQTPIPKNASVQEGIQSLYLDYLKPVYLIFDQFEELFILGQKEEQQEFFETIAQLLNAPGQGSQKAVPAKIIFIMREEYIARLYDFEKIVPGLFDHRIRVEHIQPSKVEEVIRGTARAFDIKLDEPEETIKGIIENNRDLKGDIQLPYLQVYLDSLYREAEKEAAKPAGHPGEELAVAFTPALVEKIGKISDVMAVFLDEQTEQVQRELEKEYKNTPEGFTRQALNCFVSAEGTNLPLDKEQLYSQFPRRKQIIDACLEGLEKNRILRLSDREKTYEIAHDALARIIDDRRSVEEKTLLKVEKLVKDKFAAPEAIAVFLTKRELNYIEPYEKDLRARLSVEEFNFIARSRKAASLRKRIITAGAATLIIIFAILAAFAVWQWQAAYKKEKEANANRLATIAGSMVNDDPTIALRIAEAAWLLDKDKAVTDTIYKIYRENAFYKIAAKHEMFVLSVAFSPDGKTILTGSGDKTARLWNLQGNKLQEFKGHNDNVTSTVFSPDGKMILTGSVDNTARLWDMKGRTLLEFTGHRGPVRSVAFSPDGETILTGSYDKTARLWDLQGNKLQEFKGHKDYVLSVAFSPDGKTILTGSGDTTARLWDLKGKTLQVFKGHKDSVSSATFSPDGKTILTGSVDTTAWLWDLQGNMLQEFTEHEHGVTSVAFSTDSKTILTGSYDNTARLWNLQGDTLKEFKGHKDAILSVAYSPDGQTILTGSYDNTARLWDLKVNMLKEFTGHDSNVLSATFSPDGKTILTGSEDGTARLWDLDGNTLKVRVFTEHKEAISSVAFSPDGRTILTGSADNTARLWDLEDNTSKVFKGHKGPVLSAAFSPDGKTILTGSWDKTARLWDLEGNTLKAFTGHKGWISSVAFSPDGKYILTGSGDNTARLWDLRGNMIQDFTGHDVYVSSVAYSPDGRTILTGSWDKTARLWNLQGNTLQEFTGHKDPVSSVSYSPDGRTILTGSWDNTARLWNLEGNTLQIFPVRKGYVYSTAFSPDGKTILTGSGDGTARLWRVSMSLEDFLKKGNLEPLTPQQKKEYGIED